MPSLPPDSDPRSVAPAGVNTSTTDIRLDATPSRQQLVELYAAVGWDAYTRDPRTLEEAVRRSLGVVTAWSGDTLVGLARVVGDGVVIVYLQDVLVHPDFRRGGIGTRLVKAAFTPFGRARQHVLLTDTEDRQRAFYESMGFAEVRDMRPQELRAFVRFSG